MHKIIVIAVLFSFSFSSFSKEVSPDHYKIASVEWIEEPEQDADLSLWPLRENKNVTQCDESTLEASQDPETPSNKRNRSLGQLISIGEKIWKIIENGKPVVNIDSEYNSVSVLPNNSQCLLNYENWSLPKVKPFTLVARGVEGGTRVKFRLKVIYTYGGSYNGFGKFLTNVKMVPDEISVAWGFKLNVKTFVDEAANIGTKNNPIASLGLNSRIEISSIFKTDIREHNLIVTGDGRALEL